MQRLVLVLLVASLVVPAVCIAQSTDSAAAVLLAKAIASSAFGPAQSAQITGVAKAYAGSTQESGSFTFSLKDSGASTLSLRLDKLTRTEITDTTSSVRQCTWSGEDRVEHPVANHNCQVTLNWILPMFDMRTLSASLAESVDSADAANGSPNPELTISRNSSTDDTKLNALLTRLSATKIAFDATTLLPESVRFNMHPDKDANIDLPILVRYSDYRQVSGAEIPFHIQRFLNNSLSLDLTVTTASLQ